MEPELSVVVPAYNESQTLTEFLEQLSATLESLVDSYELIVVDDGSRDGTWSALAALQCDLPGLRGVRLSRNFGKEAALSAGLAEAKGELTLVMDGDFEHPIEVVPLLLAEYRASGAEVVEAVKTRAAGEGLLYRSFALAFYRLFRLLSGHELGGQTDFKLLHRSVREAWLRLSERNVFFRGLIAWMGFEHRQVPFTVPDVSGRTTRWSRISLLSLAVRSLTSFSTIPLQMVTLLGLLNFCGAVILGLQTLWRWSQGQAVEGFTTVILLQLVQGSVTFGGLGILGLYLARVYEEVKKRPRYLVAERLGGAPADSGGTSESARI